MKTYMVSYIDGRGDDCVWTCRAKDEEQAFKMFRNEVGYYHVMKITEVK